MVTQKPHRNKHFLITQTSCNGFRGRVSQVRILPGPLLDSLEIFGITRTPTSDHFPTTASSTVTEPNLHRTLWSRSSFYGAPREASGICGLWSCVVSRANLEFLQWAWQLVFTYPTGSAYVLLDCGMAYVFDGANAANAYVKLLAHVDDS